MKTSSRATRPAPLRTGSLRARTIVAVLLLLVTLLIGLAVMVDATLGASLRAQIQERLHDRAAAAAALVGTVDDDELADRLSAQGLAVRIQSATGAEIVAGPTPDQLRAGPPSGLGPGAAGPRPEPAAPADSGSTSTAVTQVTIISSAVTGDDQLVTLTSTLSDGSTLTLTASAASVGDTLAQLRWAMVAASIAVLLVAVVGVVLVVRSTLRPLDKVTTVARSIAAGGRGRRLRPSQPRTEIGRVATAFDEMLDDIEGAESVALEAEMRMRAFVSDAAHELRTPVAGIRAAADTLVRADLSGAAREELATQIAREAVRATRLLDDLLLMARLDRGLELLTTQLDLADVVASEVARVRLRRPSLQLTTVVPEESVMVEVDADRLGQVLANLVDNAARATRGVGPVLIDLSVVDSEEAVVAVIDSGPGVPVADRERIFDRLVRLDAARHAAAGAGLGLPIARGIARAHGGDVMCVPTASGARFELSVPVTGQRTNRTSVSVSPRKGSVWVSPSRLKPFRS